MPSDTALFTHSLATAPNFSAALEESAHVPLPDDWWIAATDVVRSRDAIAAGRYKAVNMAGVSMISAAMNALGDFDVPYAFGGDGAIVAVAPGEAATMRDVLAKTVTLAREELDLELRAALAPVSRLRADGFDVRVEAVRISDAIRNFAFSGGGISHAERLLKAGEYAVAAAAPGERPDLTGLSCRWTPVSAAGRKIVSLIVEPGSAASKGEFADASRAFLRLLGMEGDGGSPIPPAGPGIQWPAEGAEIEARATRGKLSLAAMRRKLRVQTFLAWLIFRTGVKVGGFDPKAYRRVTGQNTDFRKLQDGMRMTLSFDAAQLRQAEEFLEDLRARKLIRYGLCVQEKAVLTCFVPSVTDDAHFHFLDGAGGGYAGAATAMRE